MIYTHRSVLNLCRVVHAKAAGAWGEFEVTHDITNITSANFLGEIGKKTKVLVFPQLPGRRALLTLSATSEDGL
jgi:hypothetical protein